MTGSALDRLAASLTRFSNPDVHKAGLLPLVLLLAAAVAASFLITWLYLAFYASRATGSQVQRSFPLLALSVTAIFLCIQFSLPLSLGLLGALSIVRFRTPIKEPEEIGFVMLVIAASIACATFNLGFLLAVLGVAVATLAVRRAVPGLVDGAALDGSLVLAMDASRFDASRDRLLGLVHAGLRRARLESVTRDGERVVVSFTFRSAPPARALALEAELRALVELRSFTLLYSRPGAL